MNISTHLMIDTIIIFTALTITLVLRSKSNTARNKKYMINSKEKQEFKKNILFKILNFLIYGSFITIGIFLVYLYSSYIFINK